MIRRALAVALATAAMVAIPVGTAQARACALGNYCTTTWYADSAHTVINGQLFEDCNGGGWMTGVRQGYIEFVELPC